MGEIAAGGAEPDEAAPVDRRTRGMADKIAELKPRLRGWVHAGFLPFLLAAAVVLVVLSPTAATRWGSSIYVVSAILLFTVSATYHRGTWEIRLWAFWRRFDHANIYVLIAGTYTPFAILYLDGGARWWLLGTVWVTAVVSSVLRVLWIEAPRWVFTVLYIALGWLALPFIPAFIDGADQFPTWVNVAALALVASGGVIYTIGGVVYASKRPNPLPETFGFHEIFHLCTVLAFVAQYVAVSVVTYSLR
ncbi:PAQR family membrane homeostasis protein TrhA [Aeromicrobium sp. Sec7.5]|uniref:PAQR family membrane homeostasis protein TrhA n=1 Tax=Aeromicrobium sp. Sec7.5 TaxID=3121276 RepID=UPI002FE478FE